MYIALSAFRAPSDLVYVDRRNLMCCSRFVVQYLEGRRQSWDRIGSFINNRRFLDQITQILHTPHIFN